MEKRDRLVEVADLDPVAYFEEALVLLIDSEDENIPAYTGRDESGCDCCHA